MEGVLVHGEHFQLLVGEVQNGAAGGLVHAPVLHAHQPVFNDVDDADAVGAAQSVELFDNLGRLHLLAVHGHGRARFKVDGHIGGNVGRLQGRDAHFQETGLFVVRLVGGVFQIKALVAQVPQVLVLGVVGLPADFQGDVMGFGEVDLLVPGLDVPLPPGGDDLHVRGKPLDGQLKPNLIVALAGRAVADGVRALGQRDFRQLLADNGTGKGGAQQVSLILGVHFQGGDDDFVHHLVHQIGDDQLTGTGGDGLGFQSFQLVGLTDVAGYGDDLGVVVVFLQPRDDDGCIQTAGICKDNFLDVVMVIHIYSLQMNIQRIS